MRPPTIQSVARLAGNALSAFFAQDRYWHERGPDGLFFIQHERRGVVTRLPETFVTEEIAFDRVIDLRQDWLG